MKRSGGIESKALWSKGEAVDPGMLEYTIADDRTWDSRLLTHDILGSLGHVEGLRASGVISRRVHAKLRAGLRAALDAARTGRLRIDAEHEDVHTAVERWLERRLGPVAGWQHTGRSRNDQIACDIRLYLKERLLAIHGAALDLDAALLAFAATHRTTLWPGYTHGRGAMPSSAGAWAAGFAEGILDTLDALPTLWSRVNRSPLGTAAGYGVALPLRREAAARALGFSGVDQVATSVQAGRGKLEAAVLHWCSEIGHELSRLAVDVVAFSDASHGWLRLPAELATGSSLMPHKRNPDLFELTRARAARIDADLAAVLRVKSGLGSGYHRDFQLLKEPLMRGLDRTEEMLRALAAAVPRLTVDRAAAFAALTPEILSTDEVMRRVERGVPFRLAYRQVAEALRRGESFPASTAREILARRKSTGGLGNLGLGTLRRRLARSRRWASAERRAWSRTAARLSGRR